MFSAFSLLYIHNTQSRLAPINPESCPWHPTKRYNWSRPFSWKLPLEACFGAEGKSSMTGVQVTWQWQGFLNQGRSDGLQLHHWAKCLKDPAGSVRLAESGDYRYAKYNKRVGPQRHCFVCICHALMSPHLPDALSMLPRKALLVMIQSAEVVKQ